jgi:hypothetical protein
MSPRAIEMGSAGRAFLKMASNSNVKKRPCDANQKEVTERS